MFLFADALGSSLIQTWEQNVYQPGTNSINKTGLTPATQYWYQVSPKDPGGAEVDGFPVLLGNCAIRTFTTAA